MSDRLTCNPRDFARRSYSHESDDPNHHSDAGTGTTPATRNAAEPVCRASETPRGNHIPLRGAIASPGSRALAAKFATKPVLPLPAEPSGECVSVGHLRVAAAPPGTTPHASNVGLEDYVALESRPVTNDEDAHDLTHGETPDTTAGPSDRAARQRGGPSIQAPPGPSFEETRREQRVSLGSGLPSLGEPTALELAGLATEYSLAGAGVAIAAPASTLMALDEIYTLAHEQGDAQAQALDRDAANLAVVLASNQALPRTYVDAALHEYRGSTSAAGRILTAASRDDASYQRLVSNTERDVRQGREAAREAELDSQAALESKLESDAAFRNRFLTNAGFRHGVRAEVMLAERGHRD